MEGVKMFLSMIIGAGLAVWSAVGIALVVGLIRGYRGKNGFLGSFIMLAVAWLCVTAAVARAMIA